MRRARHWLRPWRYTSPRTSARIGDDERKSVSTGLAPRNVQLPLMQLGHPSRGRQPYGGGVATGTIYPGLVKEPSQRRAWHHDSILSDVKYQCRRTGRRRRQPKPKATSLGLLEQREHGSNSAAHRKRHQVVIGSQRSRWVVGLNRQIDAQEPALRGKYRQHLVDEHAGPDRLPHENGILRQDVQPLHQPGSTLLLRRGSGRTSVAAPAVPTRERREGTRESC